MNTEPTHFSNRDRPVVLGLGRSGLSCIDFLVAQGCSPVVADTRDLPPGLSELRARHPRLPCYLGDRYRDALVGASQILLSPGVPREEPGVAAALAVGVEVIGDIELFARNADAPVLAVTGSNGKSTVTELLGHLLIAAGLDVRVGGNLGVPALQLLQPGRPDAYVLELSSFQLESTHSLRPRVAVVLNLSPDHLDRYPDMAAYIAAKARVFNGAGMAVVNADDPLVEALVTTLGGPPGLIRYSTRPGCDSVQFGVMESGGERWLHHSGHPLMRASDVVLPGDQGLSNALAALAMASVLVPEVEQLLPALGSFAGLPHRLQRVIEAGGVTWFDDSKATNPGAVSAAIRSLENDRGQLVLIAGGLDKGADFSVLRPQIGASVRAAILIGQDAPMLRSAWSGSTELLDAGDMTRAVEMAGEMARPGDIVLLSPACASFDQYQSYAERGDDFQRLARAWVAAHQPGTAE